MSDNTSIEWSEASWNPTVGCTKVSAGCKNCYAERMHARLGKMGKGKYAAPFDFVMTWPDALDLPLHWRRPRRVFVNSMSDLFHEGLPDEYISAVFGIMAASPRHTFQLLTKRVRRMEEWCSERWGEEAINDALIAHAGVQFHQDLDPDWFQWPLPNVWLGVSCEDQASADERIPYLLRTPAAVRFLSLEPLLAPIDMHLSRLPNRRMNPLHWVIVGGESGPGARPCAIEDIESVVEQCREVDVRCFVKQLGRWPTLNGKPYQTDFYGPPGKNNTGRLAGADPGAGVAGMKPSLDTKRLRFHLRNAAPCPFCGSLRLAINERESTGFRRRRPPIGLRCLSCLAVGPWRRKGESTSDAWNRRKG